MIKNQTTREKNKKDIDNGRLCTSEDFDYDDHSRMEYDIYFKNFPALCMNSKDDIVLQGTDITPNQKTLYFYISKCED
jgi:hypothetical protein